MTELDYEAHYEPAATAELASLAMNAGRALADEKRHYEIACQENARLRAVVARLRQMTDHWEQQLPEVIRTPAVVSAIRAVLEAADEPSRMADEAQQPASTAPLAANLPLVQGRCPACNGASLFLGDGDYVTCSRIDCPEPDAASTALEQSAVGAQQPETQAADRAAIIAEILPTWEAMYEPGNVSDYLIGYANDEAPAKAAAEAWMRSQAEVTGRLEWVSEERLATGRYDQWFELIERHDGGIDTGPGLIVRRRVADEARARAGERR